MIPWLQIDSAAMPGGGELRLKRRGAEFSIMAGTTELMNSRLSGSERALATLAADRLDRAAPPSHASPGPTDGTRSSNARGPATASGPDAADFSSALGSPTASRSATAPASSPGPRILIGGLGMGFTLRAALARFGPDAAVIVAELVPAVVAWARGPMAELFEGCLDDPRVTIAETDVAALIRAAGAGGEANRLDAILLDVDNGPEGLTRPENDRLYSRAGLAAAKAALRPGGVLAVWSQAPDRPFATRLTAAGFAVEEHKVHAHGSGGRRHVVWVAQG